MNLRALAPRRLQLNHGSMHRGLVSPQHMVAPNARGGLLLLAAKGGGPFGDAGGFGKRGGKPDGSSGGSGTSGSGSSKAGRRGSKSGGAGKKPVALRSRDTPPPKDLTISPPLTVTLLEEGKTGLLPDPWWSTFCNHLSGEWFGQYGAYTPWEGQPEPVWLDGNNKYMSWVYSRAVEQRAQDPDSQDRFLRKIARATSMDEVARIHIPIDVDSVEGDDVDVEALTYNTEGVVVFDGGHYSAGPDFIGPPEFKRLKEPSDSGSESEAGSSRDDGEGEQEEASAPTTTSVMEQMLVDWGNKLRMRVVATVRIGHTDQGEVDVGLLRLVLHREVWAGMPGQATLESAKSILEGTPCTLLPRAKPADVCGEWSCFTVSAVGIEDEDALSGEQQVMWVYTSSEDKQEWELPGRGVPEDGDEGGTLWLPGGVLVTLKMVNMQAGGGSGEPDSEGGAKDSPVNAAPPVRGLCMSTTWLQSGGTALQMERFYDGGGVLRDVRLTRAVKGGWVGGSM